MKQAFYRNVVFLGSMWIVVNNDTSKFRLLQYLEKVIKSQGAIPVSLGMINGNVKYLLKCE